VEEYMGKEITLWEFNIETSIEKKINEFGTLSDKIDKVKSDLELLVSRYKVLEGEIRPILEELSVQNRKSIQTKKYLITLKRKGYDKESYKYKETFEESLTKVNDKTRRLLEELLQSTKTISRVVSTIGVQRIGEGVIGDLWRRFVKSFKLFLPFLKKRDDDLDRLNGVLSRMVG
jgi:acetolactate synthase small subunit